MRGFIYILIISILVVGCETKSNNTEQDPEQLRSTLKPTPVKIHRAEIKPFEYLIYSTGKIQPEKEVEIKFKISGQVEKLNYSNGEIVKQGALLASLEDEQQQLALRKAAANLEQKKFEYESEMLSFSMGEMSADRIATIKKNIKHSSGLVRAELDYEEALLQLNYTKVKAPMSGLVSNLTVKEGNYINASDILCTIYSPHDLEVVTELLEGDLAEIETGNTATISPIDHSLSTTAIIKEINPRVNNKGLVEVTLRITGTTASLLPGMNAEVVIRVPKKQNVIVPKDAIVIRSGREVVFVAEGEKAKWHYVTTGLSNGKEVEIIEGLNANDKVIISNNLQLAHDALIVIE